MHPWSFLAQFGPPNVDWCEAGLNAWITEPANTWSNFSYIVVALLIWKSSRASQTALLRYFAPATMALGIFSGAYHASSTFALQIFDFFGMFLVFLIPLFINLKRLGANEFWTNTRIYWLVSITATMSLPFWNAAGFPIQALIGILALLILTTEITIRLKAKAPASYRHYLLSAGFFAVGAMFSAADITRIFCEPGNHWIQGHALWHVLTAVAIFFCFGFYQNVTRETLV